MHFFFFFVPFILNRQCNGNALPNACICQEAFNKDNNETGKHGEKMNDNQKKNYNTVHV